ncbi:hypothetical protein [Mesoflavibacter zeaxanthinifaciens]|uniref:hypothetical protein n=1 Tax=Mesoflavibacter zeaxanthinifaciens TaxID=393060 RepID=UPI0003FD3982|nr:hypothetical protein [Mesoflavibacter zeaxanthinifaciens]
MNTERIKLFEADIDVDGIIKKSVDLKKEIYSLKLEQQKLKSTVGETSEEFIKTEARLKKVSAEYRLNQRQVENLTETNGKLLSVEQKLTLALNKEVLSIDAANKNNKELKKIRNQVNIETEEGQRAIAEINEKLNRNTDIIKGNVSALEEQKIGIGGYKDAIKEALDETNIFKDGLTGVTNNILVLSERSKEAGGSGAFLKNSLKSAGQGLVSLTKAAIGFIATPLGATLAILVGAFALIKSAMNRSEESTNKIKRAFSAFQGISNALFKILQPLGEFLIDGIVKGFELAEKAIYKGIEVIASGLELLGFEDEAKALKTFNAEVQKGAKDTKALADAEARLEKEQRKAQLVQLEYQKAAEKLRQIRDDTTKSIPERIRANAALGQVLQTQLQKELEIAQAALEVANLRIQSEGETKDALDQQAEALTTIADIQERITGQQSEQIRERVALQKEANDQVREAAEKRIEKAEQELEFLKEQRRFNEQNLEELKFLANEEIKILDKKLESKLLSETEYATEVLKINNDLKQFQIEANETELGRIIEFNNRKNELQNEIDLRNIEDANQRAIAKAEQDYQRQLLELEQLELNEQQKTELLSLIETERGQIISEIQQNILEDRLAKELEVNKRLIESDETTANIRASLAQTLTSTLTGFLGDSLAAKLASIAVEAAAQAGLVKIESAGASARVASNVAAANAAAIAASPLTAGLPFTALNTAQGAALQANIGVSTAQAISRILAGAAIKSIGTIGGKIKKAEHGAVIDIGGKRHSSGGTKFWGEDGTAFEAEKDEKMFILNRRASAAIQPLLSKINQQYGGVSLGTTSSYLQSGGQILRANSNDKVDYSTLSNVISAAVEKGSEMGSLKGALEGSRQGSLEGSYKGSSQGTHSGIAERIENDNIEAGANF